MTNKQVPSAPPAENTQQQENQDAYYPVPPTEYFQQRAEALRYPALAVTTYTQPNTQQQQQPQTGANPNPQQPSTPQQHYPHPHHHANAGGANVSQHTVHVVHQPPPVLLQQCRFCHRGVVKTQTDVCCFVCLILLAIFTFPIGLVFLCCLGCAFRRRCVICRRRN